MTAFKLAGIAFVLLGAMLGFMASVGPRDLSETSVYLVVTAFKCLVIVLVGALMVGVFA